MGLVCGACARVNPAEALYCYFDGRALPGARGSGPVAAGSQPFYTPFVFPSGRTCRSFDELLLACYQNWSEAQELLKQGYFEGFMGGVGRADLARWARQSAGSADMDRGLDDFLGRLPATVREPARLSLAPTEINLGQIDRTLDRRLELHIENQGMALLHGTVACEDTPWLMLGDGAASTPKRMFQCLHDLKLPVHVLGERTRAGNKPLEGRIVLESNGGRATVTVRIDVPVVPFKDGVLAGARSPRQVAERARATPREAAPLFEKGAVAEWYKANGWIYPIQGEPASGLGAVQQFFEALGLTTPPRVEISTQAVTLAGLAGSELEHTLQLRTVENRPVFAHAVSMVPWLKIGRVTLEGRTARIRLIVPDVPEQPGERLLGKVQVTSNGNQRFTVAVSLQVTGPSLNGARPRSALKPVTAPMPVLELPPAAPADLVPMLQPWNEPPPIMPAPVVAMPPPVFSPPLAPPPVPPRRTTTPEPPALLTSELPAAVPLGRPNPPRPAGKPAARELDESPARRGISPVHFLPIGVIVAFLIGFIVHDVRLKPETPIDDDDQLVFDPDPYIELRVNDGQSGEKVDRPFRTMPPATMRFSFVILRARGQGAKGQKTDHTNKLTYDNWGRTNNCIVRIDARSDDGDDDEHDYYFGHVAPNQRNCRWVEMKTPLGKDDNGRLRDGYRSIWMHEPTKTQVTQTVEVVAGDVSQALDTCLVIYQIENKDTIDHKVGLRFMLDTYIGGNDGVPFLIPGRTKLCSTKESFNTPASVPDFIEAMEKDSLSEPGTVARLQFKLGGRFEAPSKVFLGGWPDGNFSDLFNMPKARGQFTKWAVPEVDMLELQRRAQTRPGLVESDPDSAVTMYWGVRTLKRGEKRELAFTYGLGQNVSGQSNGRLSLSFGGRLVRGGEFTVTAQVNTPADNERVTLQLPDGLELAEGTAEQSVPPVAPGAARRISPVTWRVKAVKDGVFELQVNASSGAKETKKVKIRAKGVFD